MQANTAGANSPYDSSTAAEVDQVIDSFVSEVDVPEPVAEEFSELMKGMTHRLEEAEREAAIAKERAREAEERAEQAEERVEELESRLSQQENHSGKERAELSGRVSEIEQELGEGDGSACSEGRGAGSSEDNPHGSSEEETPLERVCALPESVVEDNLTRNQRRARSIARRISSYGKSVPAGIAIPSSRIKRVLTAQEDSTIHRQTVARVADFLKQFGDGDVKIKKTRSGEKTVVFTDELVEAVTGVVTDESRGGVTPAVV